MAFFIKNNSIDEAWRHFSFESLLFQPSPSWWLTALTALPWPPGSGPLTQQALFDGTPKSKHWNQAGILLSTSAGRKPTARLQDFFGHCWWVLQVFMAPCLHLPPALHIFFLVWHGEASSCSFSAGSTKYLHFPGITWADISHSWHGHFQLTD